MAEATETTSPAPAKGPIDVSTKEASTGSLTVSFSSKKEDSTEHTAPVTAAIRFVNKDNQTLIVNENSTVEFTKKDNNLSTTLTLASNQYPAKIKDYFVQVKIGDSEWSSETYWVLDGALTFRIGNSLIVLNASAIKDKRFSLTEPIIITYLDIKALVDQIATYAGSEFKLPTELPDGRPLSNLFKFYVNRFEIDMNEKTFALDLLLEIGAEFSSPIPGISFESVGFSIKRTNPDVIPIAPALPPAAEAEEVDVATV